MQCRNKYAFQYQQRVVLEQMDHRVPICPSACGMKGKSDGTEMLEMQPRASINIQEDLQTIPAAQARMRSNFLFLQQQCKIHEGFSREIPFSVFPLSPSGLPSIYDVRAEGEDEGSRNVADLRSNSIDFSDREGEGVKEPQKSVDVMYGGPLVLLSQSPSSS